MRRIDRYLLKEMLVPAMVGGVLVLILLAGNSLFMLLKSLCTGVPPRDIVWTIIYFVPTMLMLAIPASLLMGVTLSLNRLVRDRELMTLQMSGVRLTRTVLPFIVLGLLAAGVLFYLQERVIPYTTHEALKLSRKLAFGSPAALLEPDTVKKYGNYLVYAQKVDPNTQTLQGVTIMQISPSGDGTSTWFVIPLAENDHGVWTFKADPATGAQPYIYAFGPTDIDYAAKIGTDSNFKLPSGLFDAMGDTRSTADEFTLREMLDSQRQGIRGALGGYGLSNGVILTRGRLDYFINKKLAAPFAALVAILIAIPLSVRFGRSGGYVGLLLSVLVAFFFVIFQQWTDVLATTGVLAETNRLQPILLAWAPYAAFGLLGLILLFREE
jgi:lipopolysaccharide export system permease protein